LTSENTIGINNNTDVLDILKMKTEEYIDMLAKEYPLCKDACDRYKSKLTVSPEKNLRYGPDVSIYLSHILQLIYSLIDNYGSDNTDFYMSDSSCWITNEFNFDTNDASPIVKAVNAKLTTLLTEHNILHGGRTSYNTRKRRKTLRKKTKLRRKPIFKY